MRCRDVEKRVTAYVDGHLDDARASAVRGHARTCDACRELIEAEVAVRDAAGDLDPSLDPPASLWEGIQARIADAEVADSERSRLWLWWQGVRRHVLVGLVAGAAAAAVTVVWIARDRQQRSAAPVESTAPTQMSPPPATVAESATVTEQWSAEIERTETRYRETVDELLAIAAEERAGWGPDLARAFDERLAELDAAVRRERLAAAGQRTPAARDALFAAYQTQISFLSEAAVAGRILE